jgi:hypothetical protein
MRHPTTHGACRAIVAIALFASLALLSEPLPAIQLRSPHTSEACLDCHKRDLPKGNPAGLPLIIVPEGDDPHRAILATCSGCHPKDMPAFWLLAFPRRKGVQPPVAAGPAQPGSSAPGQPVPATPSEAVPAEPGQPTFDNPHDVMQCDDCHKNKVAFGQPAGGDRELIDNKGDMTDFCVRCHDKQIQKHFSRGNVPGGKTTCLTCHQVHRPTSVPPALRRDYRTFIRETTELNPHGGTAGCLSCHPTKPLQGDTPEFLYGDKAMTKLCLRCHTKVDHHPFDRSSSKGTWKMDFLRWPLQDGRLTCITCHLPHGGLTRAEGGAGYSLRGEPYTRMNDFCRSCHEGKGWEKLNPHDQLTPSGEIIAKSCLFCHVRVPEVKKDGAFLPASEFNDTLTGTCTQCHENFPHPEVNHVVNPTTVMRDTIEAYSKKREVDLPLDFDGKVTCVTCHNPHSKGLLSGPKAVGADEAKKLRLATFNEICSPCHGRH